MFTLYYTLLDTKLSSGGLHKMIRRATFGPLALSLTYVV